MPDALREEAAREVFERLDLAGLRLVAMPPRAEHAWLLGMAATKGRHLVLVGATGLKPAGAKHAVVEPGGLSLVGPSCRVVVPDPIATTLAAELSA